MRTDIIVNPYDMNCDNQDGSMASPGLQWEGKIGKVKQNSMTRNPRHCNFTMDTAAELIEGDSSKCTKELIGY